MGTNRNPNQNSAALWRIFSSNKSAPANRKEGFYTNCVPKRQEVGGSELRSLYKYSRSKLEDKKNL